MKIKIKRNMNKKTTISYKTVLRASKYLFLLSLVVPVSDYTDLTISCQGAKSP